MYIKGCAKGATKYSAEKACAASFQRKTGDSFSHEFSHGLFAHQELRSYDGTDKLKRVEIQATILDPVTHQNPR